MNNLPIELLVQIFGDVSAADLICLSFVNKKFYLITETLIKHHLLKSDKNYEDLPFPTDTPDRTKLLALLKNAQNYPIVTKILGVLNGPPIERLIYLPNNEIILQQIKPKSDTSLTHDTFRGKIYSIEQLIGPEKCSNVESEKYKLYSRDTLCLISTNVHNESINYCWLFISDENLTLRDTILLLSRLRHTYDVNKITSIIDYLKGLMLK